MQNKKLLIFICVKKRADRNPIRSALQGLKLLQGYVHGIYCPHLGMGQRAITIFFMAIPFSPIRRR
jgi:hypothetical protein